MTKGEEKPIEVGAPITNSIIVRGDRAYVAHYNNRVVSFDLAKRTQRWEFGETDFPFWASPAVTEDAVYAAGRDKRVYRINPEDGERGLEHSRLAAGSTVPRSSVGRPYTSDPTTVICMRSTRLPETRSGRADLGEDIRSSPAIAGGFLVIATGEGPCWPSTEIINELGGAVAPLPTRWEQRWEQTRDWLSLGPIFIPIGDRLFERYSEPGRLLPRCTPCSQPA